MGIFSKSSRDQQEQPPTTSAQTSTQSAVQQPAAARDETRAYAAPQNSERLDIREDVPGALSDEFDVDDSNVEPISPLAMKMQERKRKLDSLKSRIGNLSDALNKISSLADESDVSIGQLSEYIETSKSNLETEIRLKSENAKLTTTMLELRHKVDTLTSQLEESEAQVHALKKRGTEARTALEAARNDIISIRENNKKLNEEYRAQSERLVDANSKLAEVTDQYTDLEARFKTIEHTAESLRNELDALSKRESELQQNLSESNVLLEEEVKKSQRATNDLESTRRELSESKNEGIDLSSQLDVALQENDYSKNRLEELQRKHDNEAYSLKSEIENLTSQRRIGAQALKDMTEENRTLQLRQREMSARMQEIEHLLGNARKNHERDRDTLVTTNERLREINLRYNSVLTDLNHERKQNERYQENIETLVEENKKLQQFKFKHDTAQEQIVELKALIANYQAALEENTEGALRTERSNRLSRYSEDVRRETTPVVEEPAPDPAPAPAASASPAIEDSITEDSFTPVDELKTELPTDDTNPNVVKLRD